MTDPQFQELKELLVRTNRWAVFGFALAMIAIGGGCVAYIDWKDGGKVSRPEYEDLLKEVRLLRRDNQVMYFLVSLATDQNNVERAKTLKRFNDFKKANGLN